MAFDSLSFRAGLEFLDEEIRIAVLNGYVSKYSVWLRAPVTECPKFRQKNEFSGDSSVEKQKGHDNSRKADFKVACNTEDHAVSASSLEVVVDYQITVV
ncbi:hypothetical protein ACOSQ2_007087 [Xanthoceras sorbifolium]